MNTRYVVLLSAACGALILGGTVLQAGDTPASELIGNLKSADEAVRVRSIDQLGAMGEKAAEAVAPLAELLKDDSPTVRAHALWSLGAIGAPAKSAVPAIIELLKDPDETVRRQVVKTIQSLRPGPQVTVPLCVKLLEDSDPGVRVRVLSAIADTGAQAVPGLIEALRNENAAYWACVVLREMGPAAKDAVPALAEKLKDPRPEIRREAILALGAMKEAAIPVVPQIASTLNDEHTRMAATFVLGEIGQIPANAEATLRANAKGDDRLLGIVSLWALARVHPDDKDLYRRAAEQLIGGLKDPDPFVRVTAAEGLMALPPAPEITLPLWEEALRDADEATVRMALDALVATGAPAVPRLVEALKHEKTRPEVAYLLGRLGPAAAPATLSLANLLDDKNARVAHEAALALANIGPGAKESVPALVKALERGKDTEANFTSFAHALGKIGPGAAAAEPVLLGLIESPDRNVALVSAWALTQIEPTAAQVAAKVVPVLVEGLGASLPASRQTAAEGLGALGTLAKDAVPALQKASADEDKSVRDAAAKALARISRKPG